MGFLKWAAKVVRNSKRGMLNVELFLKPCQVLGI